ncbi:universal stress protein [Pleurocapsa sp. PCC 7319]|uniref:universal stress protein n=1 Tax=Pleurocapsa sp. PCC 7319 TaxID=118161 RepID=UPI00034B13DB|nr:universal stress protein [Pleurocapsa sp. PCC 7319]
MFDKILVALSDSSDGSTVFDYALSIAKPKISQMLLLHFIDWQVVKSFPLADLEFFYGMDLPDDCGNWSHKYLEQKVAENGTWLKSYAEKAHQHDISCQYECQIGSCNSGIGDRAKEWEADLIVIGRRGHENISEILLGSVSNYVVHHAPCSVLVVQGSKTTEVDELDGAVLINS